MALGDEAIGAAAAAFVGKRKAVELGEDDHAQVWAGEADLLESLQPIDPRHAEIEENQVRFFCRSDLHRILAITGGTNDLKPPSKFEVITNRPKSRRRIIGNENANRRVRKHDYSKPDAVLCPANTLPRC